MQSITTLAQEPYFVGLERDSKQQGVQFRCYVWSAEFLFDLGIYVLFKHILIYGIRFDVF